MGKKRFRSLRCPVCRKIVLRTEAEFPFCSPRCRLIDLGKWASGGYVISTPITDPDALGAAEPPPPGPGGAVPQETSPPSRKDADHGRTRD